MFLKSSICLLILLKSWGFRGVSKIILPGVGAFDHAMIKLKESGMREKLTELALKKSIPVIGICVGYANVSPFERGREVCQVGLD